MSGAEQRGRKPSSGVMRAAAAVLTFAAISVVPVPGVAAQDDPNDVLRELIPEGAPGEFDLVEEDERFGRLVSEFGESTSVADFGDGSQLTGPCGGHALSYNADGELIDAAFDAGDDGPPIDIMAASEGEAAQAFTSSNPFRVDTGGVVAYFGFYPREGDGPRDHIWEIVTEGLSLDSGGDPNSNGNNRNAGIVDLAEELPLRFSAKGRVEGSIISDLTPCFGSGFVQFEGPFPLATLPGAAGGLAALVGVFGLLFNSRPAVTWKA